MAKLTKEQFKLHNEAEALLNKDVLCVEEREFVLEHWDPSAAAWDAGAEGAVAKLAPVMAELQASAVLLIERMCALTDDDVKKAA